MALVEAILGLLYDGPKTGYEVKKFYRDTIKNFWNVSDGQLYPTLKKMHEEGIIEKKEITEGSGLRKHLYTITDKGREKFLTWLRKPVNKFEEMKEPFLIKLFFFDKLSDEEKMYHLKVQYDVHQEVLNDFLEVRNAYGKVLTEYQKMIVELGMLYIQLRIFLLLRLMQMVKNKKKEKFLPEDITEILWRLFYIIFSGKPWREFFKDNFFEVDVKQILQKFTED